MNFHHRQEYDSPEINLIPLIDVLLVILIFLAASTSFVKKHELTVNLPQAQAQAADHSPGLELVIDRDGRYMLDGHFVSATSPTELAASLRQLKLAGNDTALRINADAQAAHATVVLAMEAARLAEIPKVQFIVQSVR